MAAKNSVKVYVEQGFYHVYNRGVEKRDIFLDEQDYGVFLSYLSAYLIPKDISALKAILGSPECSAREKEKASKLLKLKNYYNQVELVCYALLPNHFHLLIRDETIELHSFMNALGTRYSGYFNRKYKRQGVLFQDVYKAVLVEDDEQLLVLSRYIHQNATHWLGIPIQSWRKAMQFPNSIPEYLGERHTSWLASHYILDYFSKSNPDLSYADFLGINVDEEIIAKIWIDGNEQ